MVETTRRQEIEEAASSLFREHGYSGTSVRDIARAVDIQGASLYAHVDLEAGRPVVDRRAHGGAGSRRPPTRSRRADPGAVRRSAAAST